MTLALVCIAWVFAATGVAMFPLRLQYIPGVLLMLSAPLLILWIASTVNWWVGVFALVAFVSMFRNPLRFFWAKLRGQNPQLPPELGS